MKLLPDWLKDLYCYFFLIPVDLILRDMFALWPLRIGFLTIGVAYGISEYGSFTGVLFSVGMMFSIIVSAVLIIPVVCFIIDKIQE